MYHIVAGDVLSWATANEGPLCVAIHWYACVAVPQVLQLREVEAPAMQSCKPLPCGTGS